MWQAPSRQLHQLSPIWPATNHPPTEARLWCTREPFVGSGHTLKREDNVWILSYFSFGYWYKKICPDDPELYPISNIICMYICFVLKRGGSNSILINIFFVVVYKVRRTRPGRIGFGLWIHRNCCLQERRHLLPVGTRRTLWLQAARLVGYISWLVYFWREKLCLCGVCFFIAPFFRGKIYNYCLKKRII